MDNYIEEIMNYMNLEQLKDRIRLLYKLNDINVKIITEQQALILKLESQLKGEK